MDSVIMNIELLLGVEELSRVELYGRLSHEVKSLCYDSREVEAGSCFFAVVGVAQDGHDYIESAIERGASVVVCQYMPTLVHGDSDNSDVTDVTYVVSSDVNRTMGICSGNFYGNPSRELQLVAVTGTNGKTTTATLLADLFIELGYRTGLISTVNYRIAQREYPSTHTTPDAIRLNRMLREMVSAGCEYCFMEISSHAIVQRRSEGLKLRGVIFSNITHDHLDYHGTFAEYLRVKKSLFDGLTRESFALTNIDDRNGEVMVQNCRAAIVRYSLQRMADYRAKVVETHLDGMLLSINGAEVWAQILGRFNAYNLLAAYATAELLGFGRDEILLAISKLRPVRGRFEHLEVAGRIVIIDYAHTPDALQSVLQTIAELRRASQQLITICGCGGDRDKTKRPEMARIAYEGSSIAIFTSDNPRSEEPEAILRDMICGVEGGASAARGAGAAGGADHSSRRWIKITDRREAIATASILSREGDIILIAGKGHETYQIIGNTRHHFDDREEIIRQLSPQPR